MNTIIYFLFSNGKKTVSLHSKNDLETVKNSRSFQKYYYEAVMIMTSEGQVLKNRYGPTGDIL